MEDEELFKQLGLTEDEDRGEMGITDGSGNVIGGLSMGEDIASSREYQEATRRKKYGLEGDKLFDYASRVADTAAGKRKTEGQIRSERALEILTGAQRGVAASNTGFDAAQSLRTGERAAQRSEAEGEAQIGAAATLAQEQYGASLEQLLIAGEQRSEDKAFAMAQIQQQAEAAEGAMFGNVLGGILAALGTIAGAPGGPAGMAAGGAAGSALGQGLGRWVA
tara:strand:+ start:51 stop:716 length:666 start_codon:yes stop_codon:yes gene_type:complete